MARIDLYQLDDFADDFAPNKVDGSLPVWDGANSRFKPLPYITSTFSPVVYRNENATPSSTSSTSFISRHSYTSPSVPAGTYKITYGFVYKTAAATTYLEVNTKENSVNLQTPDFKEGQANAAAAHRLSSVLVTVATARALSLEMTYKKTGGTGGQTVTIERSFFLIERVL